MTVLTLDKTVDTPLWIHDRNHRAVTIGIDLCKLAVVGVVKTDQPDHIQLKSDWAVSLLNHHLPDKGLAKVNNALI
jgi:hypothetical protein